MITFTQLHNEYPVCGELEYLIRRELGRSSHIVPVLPMPTRFITHSLTQYYYNRVPTPHGKTGHFNFIFQA